MVLFQEVIKKSLGGIYPEEWTLIELGKVLKRVRRPVKVQLNEAYRQIGIRSHGKGLFYKEAVRGGEELGNKSVFWIEPDCFIVNIVFAWEMAIAKTTGRECGMIASHRFPMYKSVNNKVDIDYLTYYFKSSIGKYLLEIASPGGAGRNKTLGQTEFMKLKVPLPTLKEQQKKSEIFRTWDKAIETKEKLIKEKEKQKTGLIEKLLSGKSRYKKYNSEWKVIKIKNLCNSINDGDWIESKDQCEEGIRLLQTGNIGKGTFTNKLDKAKFISEDTFLRLKCKEVNSGDVLVSRLPEPIGRACSIPQIGNKMITSVDCTILKFEDIVLSKYFVQYTCKKTYQNKVRSLASGSTRLRISRKELGNILIRVPNDRDELKMIVRILTEADRELMLLRSEVRELKLQKAGLKQLLLNGIVRMNNI